MAIVRKKPNTHDWTKDLSIVVFKPNRNTGDSYIARVQKHINSPINRAPRARWELYEALKGLNKNGGYNLRRFVGNHWYLDISNEAEYVARGRCLVTAVGFTPKPDSPREEETYLTWKQFFKLRRPHQITAEAGEITKIQATKIGKNRVALCRLAYHFCGWPADE